MATQQYKGVHSFKEATLLAGQPSNDDDVANKKYVDDLVEEVEQQTLPVVTAADNGKILRVVDGVWTIVRAALSSIAVTTPPTKTAYAVDELFDPEGMVVTATFVDSTTAAIIDYTFVPDGALASTDTEVVISYTEGGVTKSATQSITVS